MALNLWKVGGKATNFNPLPTTYSYGSSSNSLILPPSINIPNSNAILSFWASSASGGTVHLNSTYVSYDFPVLTKNRQFYSYILSDSRAYNHIDLYDKNNNGDIVIDSINLVQAPLNQLTINGLDGFMSGNWTFQSRVTVVNDSMISLNANAQWQESYQIVTLQPNTTYTVSGISSDPSYKFYPVSVGDGYQYGSGNPFTFTTRANESQVKIKISNSLANGVFTFSKPVLNLGFNPAPYSKKTGSTMVMPTATKNLMAVNNKIFPMNTGNQTGNLTTSIIQENIPVLPNTTYTISLNKDPNFTGLHVFTQKRTTNAPTHNTLYSDIVGTANGRELSFDGAGSSYTFTTQSNEIFVSVTSGNFTGGFTVQSTYTNIQLEQGAMATSFSPYAVQMNKNPKRYATKGKNLIKPSSVIVNSYNNVVVNSANDLTGSITYSRTSTFTAGNDFCGFWVDVIPNSSYRLTWTGTTVPFWVYTDHFFGNALVTNGNASTVINSGSYDRLLIGFYTLNYDSVTPSNNTYTLNNIQLEQNTVPTPFVSYSGGLPPVKTQGLYFNGTLGNYIQTNGNVPLGKYAHAYVDFICPSAVSQTGMLIDQYSTAIYGIALFVNNTGNVCYRYGTQMNLNYSAINVCDGNIHRAEIKVVNGAATAYLDGVIVGTASNADAGSEAAPIKIGQRTDGGPQFPFQGIIKRVYVDDGTNIQINYDFTNPLSVFLNQVTPQDAINLLPSFDSPQWRLYQWASGYVNVYGKNYMNINTPSGWRMDYLVNIQPNTNYLLSCIFGANSNHRMRIVDPNNINGQIASMANGKPNQLNQMTWNSGSYTQVLVRIEANNNIGFFEFTNPQFFQLNSQAATLYGTQGTAVKQSRRLLYNKR